MKLKINEKKALYTFGCPNRRATVDRLRLLAAITPDKAAGKLFCDLAVKLSAGDMEEWYLYLLYTLRREMEGYYDAEMTLRLAEVSEYDLEGDYGEADEV